MKKIAFICILILFGFVMMQSETAIAQTKPVITAKANKKSYKPGDNGSIIINFKTSDNVKIPAEQVEVTISGENVTGTGLSNVSGGEYLDPQKVSYDFTISGNASIGTKIPVTVTITYGYCNYDSGICKRGTTTKTVKLPIK